MPILIMNAGDVMEIDESLNFEFNEATWKITNGNVKAFQ